MRGGSRGVALDTGIPCVFGVLTTDDLDQAMARTAGPGQQGRARRRVPRSRWSTSSATSPRRATEKRQLMLRLVLPKGSLERPTLQLFDDADLAVSRGSDVDYRGHDRRPPRRRSAHPAPAGDPAVRRRGSLRPRDHRARLDRGAQRRRRDAHRAALLEGHRPADPDRARGRRRLAGGSRSTDLPSGVRRAHRVPRAHPPLLRQARASTPTCSSRTARPRRRFPTSPTRSSSSPRPAARCAPRGCAVIDTVLVSYTELIANPDRVRRPGEAQGDGAAADACSPARSRRAAACC